MLDTVSRHGVRTQISWENGLPVFRRVQDVRAILAQNARQRSVYDRAVARKNPAGIRPVARIPWVVIQQLEQMGIMRGLEVIDEKRFRGFLNDHLVRHLRVDDGAPV